MIKTTRILLCLCALLLAACSDSSDSPPAALLDRYVLSSEDSVPEGVAFDPVARNFYATSLQGASITRIAADGTESVFRPADNRARIGGAKVDAEARRLWVCASQVDGVDSRVWVFDLDSAEQIMEFLLGALVSNGTCNDLALDSDGVAYVTDPSNPFLYRLDPDTQLGEVFASDPLFTGVGLGLNGITLSASGEELIVARFFPSALLRVSLSDSADIMLIDLKGDTLPPPDGLVELDGDIYAVGGRTLARVRFDAAITNGTVEVVELMPGLSTATVAEEEVYIIRSDVTNFVIGNPLELPFEIFRADLSVFTP